MLRLNVFLLTVFLSIAAHGQHHSLSSLYMFNKYQNISAYAGMEGSIHVTGNYRSQWGGLESSPRSQRLNAHLPLYIINGAGGIRVENHTQGPQSLLNFQASYNYVHSFSWGILSAGVSVGTFQYKLNGSELRTPDGIYTDLVTDHNDSKLSELINSAIGVSYGTSVYLITRYFETGLEVNQLPSYSVALKEGDFKYSTLIKWYGEGNFSVFNGFNIKPTMLIQSDLVDMQLDLNVIADKSGNVFGGIGMRGYSARTIDAIIPIVGWRFNDNYQLAYSFDIGISALRTVHEGTHEIQLTYNLNKKIGSGLPPKVIYNPRYM